MLHKTLILSLRSVASDASSTATRQGQRITSNLLFPSSTTLSSSSSSHFSSKAASKGPKASGGSKNNKLPKSKSRASSTSSSGLLEDNTADDESFRHSDQLDGEQARLLRLAEEMNDKTLDIGPNARPLFSTTPSISQLTRKDTCTYMLFSEENLKVSLPEGLPTGMIKEFEESKRPALLVRQGFLDLRDNFRRIVDPPLRSYDAKDPKVRRQILMDGPVSSGKSIALSMLVHWAREEGWLVFYVPKGKEWSHGGFFYKNPRTNLWDTPVQAAKILQDFLKYNESRLQQLPCQIFDPIPLGEGAGVGWMRGVDSMSMPEGSTLYDLIQIGIAHTHAAVGVVVRLRKELSLVKDIPVLIAIDQYNSWFTFSEFEEPVTVRSCRPIHAREISTVNAFRSMMHNDMMVGAFSHSTAVGKLRKDLPDVPLGARIDLPRYSLDEAATVCHFYLRQRLIRREAFSEEKWKKMYYLANGNGGEMRSLSPFLR